MNCYFHPEEPSVASCIDCGKGLCKTCAEKYEVSLCDNCNIKRHSENKNRATKRFIPCMLLFIVGFILFIILFNTMPDPMPIFSRIILSILVGWFMGGALWGLIITRSWFRPKTVYVKTTSGLDAKDFFASFRSVAWIFTGTFVGPFIMTRDFIKLIITFKKAKKATDAVNAGNAENT